MNIIKTTTQKTALAIARGVREQSNEILKSATTQVAPQLESRPNSFPSPKIDTPNPAEIQKKEQELLNQWRARISEEQVFVEAQGKTKHAPEGGHQIKQQQQKHELGRGAKN